MTPDGSLTNPVPLGAKSASCAFTGSASLFAVLPLGAPPVAAVAAVPPVPVPAVPVGTATAAVSAIGAEPAIGALPAADVPLSLEPLSHPTSMAAHATTAISENSPPRYCLIPASSSMRPAEWDEPRSLITVFSRIPSGSRASGPCRELRVFSRCVAGPRAPPKQPTKVHRVSMDGTRPRPAELAMSPRHSLSNEGDCDAIQQRAQIIPHRRPDARRVQRTGTNDVQSTRGVQYPRSQSGCRRR